jgi:hypothetical protein
MTASKAQRNRRWACENRRLERSFDSADGATDMVHPLPLDKTELPLAATVVVAARRQGRSQFQHRVPPNYGAQTYCIRGDITMCENGNTFARAQTFARDARKCCVGET